MAEINLPGSSGPSNAPAVQVARGNSREGLMLEDDSTLYGSGEFTSLTSAADHQFHIFPSNMDHGVSHTPQPLVLIMESDAAFRIATTSNALSTGTGRAFTSVAANTAHAEYIGDRSSVFLRKSAAGSGTLFYQMTYA